MKYKVIIQPAVSVCFDIEAETEAAAIAAAVEAYETCVPFFVPSTAARLAGVEWIEDAGDNIADGAMADPCEGAGP